MRELKAQSAVEFLTTYAWALTIVVIFVAFVIAAVGFRSPTSFTTSSCYLTATVPCQELLFQTRPSMSESYATLVFINGLGTAITFPQNSVSMQVGFSSIEYYGTCLPADAPADSTVICNVTLPGFSPDVGAEVDTKFTLSYGICDPSGCPPSIYNTSGDSTGTVSSYSAATSVVDLQTSTGTGSIAVSGVAYPSNTYIRFINGISYQVDALPTSGNVFSTWAGSPGIAVANTVSAVTNVTTSASGSLIATFT